MPLGRMLFGSLGTMRYIHAVTAFGFAAAESVMQSVRSYRGSGNTKDRATNPESPTHIREYVRSDARFVRHKGELLPLRWILVVVTAL